MKDIGIIALNEIRRLARSGVLAVLAGLVAFLLLASGFIGWRHYERLNEQRSRYQDVVVDQWEAQPDRHPHRVSHYGFLVFRPKPPLSFFDFGIDSYTGTSLYLEPHRQNTANFSEARHATGMLRFGEMSIAQVLQLLVPLLIFFVAFSAIPRERELGTLPLLLTQGVRFDAIVLGKTFGIFAVVVLWTAPALVATLFALSLTASWTWDADLLSRVGILSLGYGAYLWICTLGAVIVSALHRSSRSSLATLITIWIALWVVVPRALPNLGEALHPAPSKASFDAALEADLRVVGDSHNPDDMHFRALREKTLKSYGASELGELPVNYKGVVMVEAEKNTTSIFRAHYTELLDTHKQQNRYLQRAAWLNPFLAIRELSMAMSGTDFEHYEHFQWAAESYRFDLVQQLNALHADEVAYADDVYVRPTTGPPTRQRIAREHFAELPAFDLKSPDLAWSLSAHRSSLWVLAVWLALVTVGAVRFRGRVR